MDNHWCGAGSVVVVVELEDYIGEWGKVEVIHRVQPPPILMQLQPLKLSSNYYIVAMLYGAPA